MKKIVNKKPAVAADKAKGLMWKSSWNSEWNEMLETIWSITFEITLIKMLITRENCT